MVSISLSVRRFLIRNFFPNYGLLSGKNFLRVLLLIFLHLPFSGNSQDLDLSGELYLSARGGNDKGLPFWMYANSRGRFTENTHFLTRLSGKAVYTFYNESELETGGGILFRNGSSRDILADEAYLGFRKEWFELTLGRRHQQEIFGGLSATNQNILWSVNTEAPPGVKVAISPLYFSGDAGLGVEMLWSDYILEEDLPVPNTKLHHKSFFLLYKVPEEWLFRAGLRHMALWGDKGNSGVEAGDYLSVVTGRAALVPTNPLGSLEFEVTQNFQFYSLRFFYNSIFESRKGAMLGNFPDGRYALFLKMEDKDQLINAVIYEFYTTKDQGIGENYLNHPVFRSGWTYNAQVLGVPFFTYDDITGSIINNKFSAHHVGIGGNYLNRFDSFPYRFLVSYAQNEGLEVQPNPGAFIKGKQLSTLFTSRIYNSLFFLDLQLATEFREHFSPVFGAGVSVSIQF